jgi:hypothetical protein
MTLLITSSAFAEYEVYFTESNTVNFARDKFYHAVKKEMDESLFSNSSKDILRDGLVNAHPPAQRDYANNKVQIPLDIKKMITPIQRDLETKASDKAIIIDCKPIKSNYVSNCGLYRYSRSKQRIDASSVRYFSIKIENPEKWASPILKNFLAQNSKEKNREETKLMSNFMSSLGTKNKNKVKVDKMLSLGVKIKDLPETSLNGVYAEFSKGSNDFYTSLGIGSFNSKNLKEDALAKSLGIEFGAKNLSKEVYKLKWEIAYKGHLDFNQYNNGLKNEEILGVSLAPGFNVSLGSEGKTSLHSSYAIRKSIKLTNQNDVLENSYWESNWSINISRVF